MTKANPSPWTFYLLAGVTAPDADQKIRSFWKVGTAPSGPLPTLRGRTTYGNAVDPELDGLIYKPVRNRVSYLSPRLSPCARYDPITWARTGFFCPVRHKEVDQLVAAFAEELGLLVRNRGRIISRGRPNERVRGAIELLAGDARPADLLVEVASRPDRITINSTHSVPKRLRDDVVALAAAAASWQARDATR